MRILEVALILSELVLLLLWLRPSERLKTTKWILFLPGLLLLLHASVEGIRWQMTLAYGIATALVVAALVPANLRLPRYSKIFLSSLGILLIAISLLLGYLLPVFRLPEPSGPFAVGTTYLHLQDRTRPEVITRDTTDVRELMVRVWYPAKSEDETSYPYIPVELAKMLAKNYGLPAFVLSHLALVETHALWNTPVASEKVTFPIIIFSPGYMSHSSMYTALLETLASQGYVALSIDYTYETPLSIFPGNDLRFFDTVQTDVWKNASWDSVEASIDAFRNATDVAAKCRYAKRYLTQMPYTARVDRWATDIRFVIDWLYHSRQEAGMSLFNKVDPDNIGAMGHSVGGAASAVACATDTRIKAGINLDGSQWGSLMGQTITQPFLWMTAEQDLAASSVDIDAFIYDQVSEGNLQHLSVAQATHTNFYDLSLWSSYKPLTQTGSIDDRKMQKIVSECSLTFFDRYLKEEPTTISSLIEKFDELTIQE